MMISLNIVRLVVEIWFEFIMQNGLFRAINSLTSAPFGFWLLAANQGTLSCISSTVFVASHGKEGSADAPCRVPLYVDDPDGTALDFRWLMPMGTNRMVASAMISSVRCRSSCDSWLYFRGACQIATALSPTYTIEDILRSPRTQ